MQLEEIHGKETNVRELLALLEADDIEQMLRIDAGAASEEMFGSPDPFRFSSSEDPVNEESDGVPADPPDLEAALDEICLRIDQALKPWTIPQLPDAERDPRLALRVARDCAGALQLALKIAHEAIRAGVEPDIEWNSCASEPEAIESGPARTDSTDFSVGDTVEYVGYPTLQDPPNAGLVGPIKSIGHPGISPAQNEHWGDWVVVDFPEPLGRYTAHVNEIRRTSDGGLETRREVALLADVYWEAREALPFLDDESLPHLFNLPIEASEREGYVHEMSRALLRILALTAPAAGISEHYRWALERLEDWAQQPPSGPEPLYDRARFLIDFAGIPWVDWTPPPSGRIMWSLDGIGPAERASDIDLWRRRREVIGLLAVDFVKCDLPGITIDELLDAPDESPDAARPGAHWVEALEQQPELRALLEEFGRD